MNRTTNDVHVHRHGGIAGQNTDPKPPDQVGKSFPNYKPWTNWCTKCKVEADKKSEKHGKYIPRKGNTFTTVFAKVGILID